MQNVFEKFACPWLLAMCHYNCDREKVYAYEGFCKLVKLNHAVLLTPMTANASG